jgi:hypothetical protein
MIDKRVKCSFLEFPFFLLDKFAGFLENQNTP